MRSGAVLLLPDTVHGVGKMVAQGATTLRLLAPPAELPPLPNSAHLPVLPHHHHPYPHPSSPARPPARHRPRTTS
jgi:hypothetical protein